MSCDTENTVSSNTNKHTSHPSVSVSVSVRMKVWCYWVITYIVKVLPKSLAHGFVQFLSWLEILKAYRCSRCKKCLPNWYFEKDGSLFCQSDYWARFGESCNGCSDLITGPVMVAGEHRYHPECFKCVHCDSYIGDGETYALVERSKLFCGTCYTKVMKPLLAASPRRRKPHSIQLVEIPPTPDRNRGVQFTMDRQRNSSYRAARNSDIYRKSPAIKITELNVSPDLQGLKIGDRILEVNGLNVRDKSIEDIDTIFNNSNEVLHITLERDPSPLRHSSDSDSPTDTSSPHEVIIGNTPVQLRPRSSLKARNYSPSRRRSKSPSPLPTNRSLSIDLSRSSSLRSQTGSHRVFRVNDLIIGDLLGQGFFGQAFKVTHRVTGEVMVLKELFNFNEEAQKNFLKEVHMLRNLDHSCLLKFMGVLYKDKKLNLVTEYIGGGTLQELLLDDSKDITLINKIKFLKDISNGMSYLHSMDVIHRDLTSHNCLVRLDNTVVVADFGLAKIMPKNTDMPYPDIERTPTTNTSSNSKYKRRTKKKRYTVVGSPYWMAPEMMSGKVYDERVDIFSYGIIVCEVIGRLSADPDYLPRTLDFGLNMELFKKHHNGDCPDTMFMLAALCCQLVPEKRPKFGRINILCEAIYNNVLQKDKLPPELMGCPVKFYENMRQNLYQEMSKEKTKTVSKPSSLDSICEKNKTNMNCENRTTDVNISALSSTDSLVDSELDSNKDKSASNQTQNSVSVVSEKSDSNQDKSVSNQSKNSDSIKSAVNSESENNRIQNQNNVKVTVTDQDSKQVCENMESV